MTRYAPDEAWLSTVRRARNLPLLYMHARENLAPVNVWATYHPTMPDLDWSEPDVLVEWCAVHAAPRRSAMISNIIPCVSTLHLNEIPRKPQVFPSTGPR